MVSEMVSADGLKYSFNKTISYARFTEKQHPAGIQIFGSDPKVMREGAKIAADQAPDFIDINMGCPVRKVVKRGAGSALMLDLKSAIEIIKAVKEICQEYKLPLTVKIRAGWDAKNINAPDFARRIADAGADLIIIHPRTKSQMFGGSSDWSIIKEVKESVGIPVIGNGDVLTPQDARKLVELTGCDGIMVGRGSIGKPWIFRQIKVFLEKDEIWTPSPNEIMSTIKEHYIQVINEKGETVALKEMRTHLSAYTKGYQGSARIRELINNSKEISPLLDKIENMIISAI